MDSCTRSLSLQHGEEVPGEALPRLKECGLEKSTETGCDKGNERRNRFLGQGGAVLEWPQEACTTMFFLIPKSVTSERPIALMPTLIRWWEAVRAPEVAKWQQMYRVDWDATDGRKGGAQRTVWEMWKSKGRRSRRLGLGLGPGEDFRESQSPSGLGLRDTLQLPKKDFAGALCVKRLFSLSQ